MMITKKFRCDSCKKDLKIKTRKKEEIEFSKKEKKNREESQHLPSDALLKIIILELQFKMDFFI